MPKPKQMVASLMIRSLFLSGCGASGYTILDRSTLNVSDNSRIAVKSMLPSATQRPAVVEHLALAEDVFQKQLNLLKERRNKVRARKRELGFASFGIMAATGLGAGATAIASNNSSKQSDALIGAGVTALVGLGVGTILQIAGLMQEDYGDVDDKIRHLQHLHESMLDEVRLLMSRPSDPNAPGAEDAAAGAAIERFIDAALQINVKG